MEKGEVEEALQEGHPQHLQEVAGTTSAKTRSRSRAATTSPLLSPMTSLGDRSSCQEDNKKRKKRPTLIRRGRNLTTRGSVRVTRDKKVEKRKKRSLTERKTLPWYLQMRTAMPDPNDLPNFRRSHLALDERPLAETTYERFTRYAATTNIHGFLPLSRFKEMGW